MSRAVSQSPPAPERLAVYRWPLAGAVVLFCIFIWLFWDFIGTQVRWGIKHQADWGHTLVVPFIAGYLAFHNREKLRALLPLRTTWTGLIPLVVGVAWYSVCTLNDAVRNHNLQGFGVWLTLFGLVLLFCGYRAMAYLWFPLVYLLIFGQSVSDRAMNLITFQMQDIAARGSHVVLLLLGFDADRSGNTLTIYDERGQANPLNIAEACSGMRMLMAFLALGTAMAYTGFKRLWQRALLVILAFPTAIFVNVLRVVTLSLLTLVDSGLAAGDFHTFVGLVWLVPALLIYLGLMWIIRKCVIEPEDQNAAPQPTTSGSRT